MSTVEIQIDGRTLEATEGESLLDVARQNRFDIPTLCHNEAVAPYGACRLCLVEVKKGRKQKLTTACNYPVQAGIEVFLDTEKVQRNRRMVLELLLASCPDSKELQEICLRYGVTEARFEREENDCILCGLCARVCEEVVGAKAITFSGRGDRKKLETPFGEPSELCVGCGACVFVCPVGCIKLVEADGKRYIDRWMRELDMISCKECGVEHMPRYQAIFFAKKTGLDQEFFDTCPGCRPYKTA